MLFVITHGFVHSFIINEKLVLMLSVDVFLSLPFAAVYFTLASLCDFVTSAEKILNVFA
jgi:hypothetical protein